MSGMRRTRTPNELGFDHHDRQRLARALRRATDVRTYRRVQAVLLVARGPPAPEVARLTGAKAAAIYDWVRRYLRTHHPGDLADAPRSGRPPVATAITDARIIPQFRRDPLRLGRPPAPPPTPDAPITRQFRRDPLRLGYATTGWTVALLAEHLGRAYGCPIYAPARPRPRRALGLRSQARR